MKPLSIDRALLAGGVESIRRALDPTSMIEVRCISGEWSITSSIAHGLFRARFAGVPGQSMDGVLILPLQQLTTFLKNAKQKVLELAEKKTVFVLSDGGSMRLRIPKPDASAEIRWPTVITEPYFKLKSAKYLGRPARILGKTVKRADRDIFNGVHFQSGQALLLTMDGTDGFCGYRIQFDPAIIEQTVSDEGLRGLTVPWRILRILESFDESDAAVIMRATASRDQYHMATSTPTYQIETYGPCLEGVFPDLGQLLHSVSDLTADVDVDVLQGEMQIHESMQRSLTAGIATIHRDGLRMYSQETASLTTSIDKTAFDVKTYPESFEGRDFGLRCRYVIDALQLISAVGGTRVQLRFVGSSMLIIEPILGIQANTVSVTAFVAGVALEGMKKPAG